MMIAPLLLAAVIHTTGVPVEQPSASISKFAPVSGASARATASVRIVSGASFGPGRGNTPSSASRRKTQIADQDGQWRSAELLEFQ
jgi:hypothetical protein